MKMFGLGVKNYVRDNFNLFDAIVVLLSLVDVTISSVLTPEQIGSMS
jgi:anionic cell wall polymer biosynthesis LytR-Cps2A-Psr (LCP) family protein